MADSGDITQGQRNTYIFYALAGILTLTFLWRALTPAHEYPGQTATLLDMAIDGAMIVGLFGIRKAGPQWMFWTAIVAGLGLFAIRFHSDASWWTGHWNYYLLPR